jgi:hypothetical protein
MVCNCNFSLNNPFVHWVISDGSTVSATAVELAVTNSTNIADHAEFHFRANNNVINLASVTGAPVPVTININSTAIQLWDKFGEQILSNQIPKRAFGYVSLESPTPHVILLNTPKENNYV